MTPANFNRSSSLDGFQGRCRGCLSKARKELKKERALYFYEKQDFKCLDCGTVSKRVGFFDFHHRDPSKKLFNVSSKITNNIDKVEKEVEKCDMLCPNCHRIRHIDIRENDGKEEEC